MTTMSIGKAWEEAVAFVVREAALLLPVALLFVALPGLIVQEMAPPELQAWFAAPKAETMPDIPASYSLSIMIAVILIWFGSLTLFALALRPGISVKEALRLALTRLPVLLGTSLLAGVVLFGLLFLIVFGGVLLGMVAGPSLAVLVGAVAVIAMVFIGVRLSLLNPVVIDRQDGVMVSLRQAWALTRGHFWRLLAFLAVMMILSTIVGSAAQVVVGLLGGLIAGPDGARLAGGLAAAAVSSVIQVYMLVMLARLYRQADRG